MKKIPRLRLKSGLATIHLAKRPKNLAKLHFGPLFGYGFLLFFLGIFFADFSTLGSQLLKIITSPAPLVTDYIALTSLGATLVSCGLLTLFVVFISYRAKVSVSGPLVAAIFMVSGFGLFGKNIFNSLPLLLGTYLYSCHQRRPFSSVAIVALFGSSLSPVVSMLIFSGHLPTAYGLILGLVVGVAIGFIIPPLATHFQSFTQGFNLYNVGFTSGMISMVVTGLFRLFGWEIDSTYLVSSNTDQTLFYLLVGLAICLFLLGFYFCWSEKNWHLIKIFKRSGKIMTDFINDNGRGPTLINMGLMCLLMLLFVRLTNGTLNGPVVGAILSVIGFSAYGNHPLNSVPLLIGVYLAGLVNFYPMKEANFLMAAIFSTTLGPVAGFYGPIVGVVAGFLHLALVTNVGYLHGGLNLYNNGFSGGFIAALMVPVLDHLGIGKGRHDGRKT
ncbi:DUF1576 domain-containing protein [Enterococcus timonensis]|uniref:DUF1576 domain-containing protein n=1 Tax=Enterococcus timonensis TaxID=1852364 RepID=UPI0008DA3235|nr:DUF1576 domain-containing protein [Enterococcus timonensis]